ncbi:hypothetical protein C8R47DRAFT_1062580 [Mycena vitilis]|nr:hypothetical protein C8R47DRAFT_1062580 [Mycena vitilis]
MSLSVDGFRAASITFSSSPVTALSPTFRTALDTVRTGKKVQIKLFQVYRRFVLEQAILIAASTSKAFASNVPSRRRGLTVRNGATWRRICNCRRVEGSSGAPGAIRNAVGNGQGQQRTLGQNVQIAENYAGSGHQMSDYASGSVENIFAAFKGESRRSARRSSGLEWDETAFGTVKEEEDETGNRGGLRVMTMGRGDERSVQSKYQSGFQRREMQEMGDGNSLAAKAAFGEPVTGTSIVAWPATVNGHREEMKKEKIRKTHDAVSPWTVQPAYGRRGCQDARDLTEMDGVRCAGSEGRRNALDEELCEASNGPVQVNVTAEAVTNTRHTSKRRKELAGVEGGLQPMAESQQGVSDKGGPIETEDDVGRGRRENLARESEG